MENLLARSESAINLADQFASSPPAWGRIEGFLEVLLKGSPYKDSQNIVGLIGEAWLKIFLRDAALHSGGKIRTPHIKNMSSTQNYQFLSEKNNLVINHRVGENWETLTDIDALIELENEICLWESKLNYRRAGKGALQDTIQIARVTKVIRPIAEYFSLPVGFTVVTYQGLRDPKSIYQQNFTSAGGIIIEFPVSREEILQRALAISKKLDISTGSTKNNRDIAHDQ